MEKGARVLVIIMAVALVLGGLVVAVSSAYRQSIRLTFQGNPQETPIWRSNAAYYPQGTLERKTGGSSDAE